MSWKTLVLAAVVVAASALPRGGQDRRMTSADVINQITKEGYPAELHHVTTEDGYILAVHRIPHGKSGPSTGRRPIVFVMHGLMGASSNFIFLGKEAGIAYNLADAGYDVWMGNARGNVFSRAHVSLDPDDPQEKFQFFDFSWEEIGMIDVPTMVDYALATTGERTMHYIGHSQGGTSFLVMNSMRPEYNDKFVSAHLLAGVGYKNNFPNAELRLTAMLTNTLYALGKSLGLVEIRSLADLPVDLFQGNVAALQSLQTGLLGDMNFEGLGVGGAALKQFAHYGQNIRDRSFRRWDHGILTNRQVYGSISPPIYDISKITVPTTMHYTVSDVLLDEQDVIAMSKSLPHGEARRIARDDFSHVDFVQANDVRELVTNYVIEKLNRLERMHMESS